MAFRSVMTESLLKALISHLIQYIGIKKWELLTIDNDSRIIFVNRSIHLSGLTAFSDNFC